MNFKMKKIIISTAIVLGLSTVNAQQKPISKANKSVSISKKTNLIDNKKKVASLLKIFENGDTKLLSYINPNKYIQHNLSAADGVSGLKNLLKVLPPNSATGNTVRIFQDGDYVFAHSDINFFGPKVAFDIYRFEDGKIVEHWDNLQETAKPNPSGRTMIDGATVVKDLDKTAENKTLVRNYVDDIFINGKMEKLAGYFDGDNYIQHNPFISDNLSGMEQAFAEMAKQDTTMKYNKVHKILGEGNFVIVLSEGFLAGKHTSFYDLFRVENGKIAEHWDVIEEIPAKKDWKNNNGKF